MSEEKPVYQVPIAEGLDVVVVPHVVPTALGPVPCWTYFSEGLQRHRQQEVSFVVQRRPNEADDGFPQGPMQFIRHLDGMAQQGQIVDARGRTGFGPRTTFMGLTNCTGILYCRHQALPGVPLDAQTLTAVPLLGDEFESAERCGRWRVLSQMGAATRFYPFPPWLDRDRKPVTAMATLSKSILLKVPCAGVPGLSISAAPEGQFYLRVLRSQAASLTALLAKAGDQPLALQCEPDPSADSCLVWVPGQEDGAIGPPGSRGERPCGCFVLLFPDAKAGVRTLEDGIVLAMPPAARQQLREGLAQARTNRIPIGQYTLVLEMRPDARPAAPASRVKKRGVRLADDEAHLDKAGVQVEALAEFLRTLDGEVGHFFAASSDARELDVFVECLSDRTMRVGLDARPPLPTDEEEALYQALGDLAGCAPRVLQPVRFSSHYQLS